MANSFLITSGVCYTEAESRFPVRSKPEDFSALLEKIIGSKKLGASYAIRLERELSVILAREFKIIS